jgi:hypothetical protein
MLAPLHHHQDVLRTKLNASGEEGGNESSGMSSESWEGGGRDPITGAVGALFELEVVVLLLPAADPLVRAPPMGMGTVFPFMVCTNR